MFHFSIICNSKKSEICMEGVRQIVVGVGTVKEYYAAI